MKNHYATQTTMVVVALVGLFTVGRVEAQPTNHTTLHNQLNAVQNHLNNLQTLIQNLPTDTRKRYYLSQSIITGNIPAGFCSAGYHMASLGEIFNTAALQYDTTLGRRADDSGEGPPTALLGWIRTGKTTSINEDPGFGNCTAYTTAGGGAFGTTAAPYAGTWSDPPTQIAPWLAIPRPCDVQQPVWCVEN